MSLDPTATTSMLVPAPTIFPPSQANHFPFFESLLRHGLFQEAFHDAELLGTLFFLHHSSRLLFQWLVPSSGMNSLSLGSLSHPLQCPQCQAADTQ